MKAPFRTPSLIRIHLPSRGSWPTAATRRISRLGLVGGVTSLFSSAPVPMSFALLPKMPGYHASESTEDEGSERIWRALTKPGMAIEGVLAGLNDRRAESSAQRRMLPSHDPMHD